MTKVPPATCVHQGQIDSFPLNQCRLQEPFIGKQLQLLVFVVRENFLFFVVQKNTQNRIRYSSFYSLLYGRIHKTTLYIVVFILCGTEEYTKPHQIQQLSFFVVREKTQNRIIYSSFYSLWYGRIHKTALYIVVFILCGTEEYTKPHQIQQLSFFVVRENTQNRIIYSSFYSLWYGRIHKTALDIVVIILCGTEEYTKLHYIQQLLFFVVRENTQNCIIYSSY